MERIQRSVTIKQSQIETYNPFQEIKNKTVTIEPNKYEHVIELKKTPEQRGTSSKIQRQIRRLKILNATIETKITEANRQAEERKKIRETILQNHTFKNIDLFYRTCFDLDKPFNDYLYYQELTRIKHREQQVQKLKDEIEEDKQALERYKTITTTNIYFPAIRKPLSICTDLTSPTSKSTAKQDTM